jgi:hypothetical protein
MKRMHCVLHRRWSTGQTHAQILRLRPWARQAPEQQSPSPAQELPTKRHERAPAVLENPADPNAAPGALCAENASRDRQTVDRP